MTESIYGSLYPALRQAGEGLINRIEEIRRNMERKLGMDPVEHLLYRIKSEESMREKCRRRGLPETTESALYQIHDGIGIRVVCAFLNDVYAVRDLLAKDAAFTLVEEKDYIRQVKPNGYRSLHMILQADGLYAEVQIRTISQDTWAALEHHLKYKKDVGGNVDLLVRELKRCADELAHYDHIHDVVCVLQKVRQHERPRESQQLPGHQIGRAHV